MFYNPQITHHFESPENAGTLAHPSATARVGSPEEGAVIQLQIFVEDNMLKDLKFKAYGAVAIACMSYLTQQVKGKILDDAMHVNAMTLASDLGVDSLRLHNCLLAVDALQEAITNYNKP